MQVRKATLELGVLMSTDPVGAGGKVDLEKAAADSAKLIDEALSEEIDAEQDDLFEPITAEEVLEAREELGIDAGALSIKRHVRAIRKKGRPKGAKNRANRDVQAYLRQFGPDPAVVMMKIMAQTAEEMVERSRQMDPVNKQMTIFEAESMRLRSAEGVRKIFHGDQPVQVDHTIQGVRVIEEIGEMKEARTGTIEGRSKVLDHREDDK